MKALQHMEAKIGAGGNIINMRIMDSHILMPIPYDSTGRSEFCFARSLVGKAIEPAESMLACELGFGK